MSNFDTQTALIPIDEIKRGVTVDNIRTHFDEARVRELADSIFRDGLMSPLIVMETEDDEQNETIELVAGERRLRAIQWIRENLDDEFMDDGVPCYTYVGTVEDALFANAIENIEREDVDDVDISAWLHARVGDGISQTDLAKRIHKQMQWVNFRILFHERACPELKDLLREGLISFTAAYELSKNLDEAEQKKRVSRARKFNEKISVEAAQNAGNPDKTTRPSKKQREIMQAVIEQKATDGDIKAQGASLAMRWTEGLLSDDELREGLEIGGDDD